jgi:AraC-like DNA-binding protein
VITASYLTLVDAALRGAVIALLLSLMVALLRDRPRLPLARVGVLFAICLVVQIVGSTPVFEAQVPRLWQVPFVAISVGNAVLFWIFVQAMFDDDFAFKPLHAVAWMVVAVISGLNCAVLAGSSYAVAEVTMALQRLAPLLFAVLAVIAAVSNWRSDLVERRRKLRAFILVSGVVYTIAMLVARIASPHGRLSEVTALVDAACLLVMVAMAARYLLRVTDTDLVAAAPIAKPMQVEAARQAAIPPDPAEDRLSESLQRLMASERLYRAEDLTVARVAARLAVPEYRLRRLINQRLGHRNFNAYINGFRLAEARAALADPGQRETPVLTIALGAGFQSIGPFNRAFKVATGVTPTEFRREKLADS